MLFPASAFLFLFHSHACVGSDKRDISFSVGRMTLCCCGCERKKRKEKTGKGTSGLPKFKDFVFFCEGQLSPTLVWEAKPNLDATLLLRHVGRRFPICFDTRKETAHLHLPTGTHSDRPPLGFDKWARGMERRGRRRRGSELSGNNGQGKKNR